MLSIVKQAGEEPHRVRCWDSLKEVLSHLCGLSRIGHLLKSAGEQIGWGFQFQYPVFVALMAALIFTLGLSLFGVYHIALPGSSTGFRGGESLSSSFLNGVLATVLATPCTAPFLGTALGFAFAASELLMVAVLAWSRDGVALYRPGSASWLDALFTQPGLWMERFKQGMGFLLMGTVLWLLWVLGKQVGSEGCMGRAFARDRVGRWIIGQWIRLEDSIRRRRTVYSVALAIVVASYGLFMHPVLVAAQPARVTPSRQGYGWIPFTPEAVEERVRAGQTVIDFTGNR